MYSRVLNTDIFSNFPAGQPCWILMYVCIYVYICNQIYIIIYICIYSRVLNIGIFSDSPIDQTYSKQKNKSMLNGFWTYEYMCACMYL
jgi:hypothetical protein